MRKSTKSSRTSTNGILWKLLKPAATLTGALHDWYLVQVYLPLIRGGGDIGKINTLLVHSDWHRTRLILTAMGAQIEASAYLETHMMIHNAKPDYQHLRIGPGCYVGKDCFFDLSQPITLEQDSTLAMRVTIVTHFDAGNSALRHTRSPSHAPVIVGRGAYVGASAIILPGVRIGEKAVVAAGAVVTEEVAANDVVGGVPARLLNKANMVRGG